MSVHEASRGRKRHSPIAARADGCLHAGEKWTCPVCGERTSNCSVTADGMHYCRGWPTDGDPPDGWERRGKDDTFGHYRTVGDTRTGTTPGGAVPHEPVDWGAEARGYAPRTIGGHRNRRAMIESLELPERDLVGRLPLLGFGTPHGFQALTLPMYDGNGRATGVFQRQSSKYRGIIGGGRGGLFVPDGWRDRTGPLFVTEGFTDFLALVAAEVRGVGRHSADTDAEHLSVLLSAFPPDQPIVIVGDNDDAGRKGAESVAGKVTNTLGRAVSWALPPDGFKDVREYLTSPHWGTTPWAERGRQLGEYLTTHATVVGAALGGDVPTVPTVGTDRVVIRSLDTYQAEPVEWLYRGRLPKGKLVLVAGDGGLGKSTLARHLIAKLSRGHAAFGESHVPDGPGETILVATEDGFADVVIPSLIAEGADLARVGHVDSVEKAVGGKLAVVQFGIEDLDALEAELRRRPNTKLIVIDPIVSLVGRAGVNDFKDSELRKVLDPLSRLAERTGVTILLVAHTNKSQAQRAVDRIAGSAGMKNAVRLAYLLDRDDENADQRLLMPVKRNLPGCTPSSVVFREEHLPPTETARFRHHPAFREAVGKGKFDEVVRAMSRLEFVASRTVNADDVVCPDRAKGRAEKKTRVEQCADAIRDLLRTGPLRNSTIEAALVGRFTPDNISKAKTELKDEGYRDSKRAVLRGETWWGFGEPETWPSLPHDSPDSPYIHDSHESHDIGNTSGFPMSGVSGVSGVSGESGVCGNCGTDGAAHTPQTTDTGDVPVCGTDGDASHLSVEALFNRMGTKVVDALRRHRHDPVIVDGWDS